ncbi:MAG: cell division protein FtsZ [Flavobacteriales bacterium]|nr:cell division protein FtsZ [Flavobacteriales bacterium]
MKFDLPKDQSSIIKVIGVGGGGSNAVNHMFRQGIKGVDFLVCNTDHQALDMSPVPIKIQLGKSLTDGRGAGALPDVGMNAAIENIEEIREILEKNTKMVFVTAGMGGGTGTGAAPVIAKIAKELGILTVGIVTIPFKFEGRKRITQAEEGLEKMRESVDTLLVINNDKLREMFGNLSLGNAFAQADDVLSSAAKGIAEVISVTGQINVDFNDVNTVMKDSGVAIMGTAEAEGEGRAQKATMKALASPLLNDNQISGARYVLLNITYGDQEVLMDEISEITDYIQDEAGNTADVIWGHGYDASLGDNLCITIIATGFKSTPDTGLPQREPARRLMDLEEERPTIITQPIQSPTQTSAPKEESEKLEEPFMVTKFNLEDDVVEVENSEVKEAAEYDSSVTASEEVNETHVSESADGKVRFMLEEDDASEAVDTSEPVSGTFNFTTTTTSATDESIVESDFDKPSLEDNRELTQQRLDRIRDTSKQIKTSMTLSDMENEPAYKRRNIQLDDIDHSSESTQSRFTIGDIENEDGEKRTGLSDNNSFLHDNVD